MWVSVCVCESIHCTQLVIICYTGSVHMYFDTHNIRFKSMFCPSPTIPPMGILPWIDDLSFFCCLFENCYCIHSKLMQNILNLNWFDLIWVLFFFSFFKDDYENKDTFKIFFKCYLCLVEKKEQKTLKCCIWARKFMSLNAFFSWYLLFLCDIIKCVCFFHFLCVCHRSSFFFELTLSVFRSYWFEFWFYTKSKMVEINWSQNEFWSLNKICKYDRGTRVCCHIHRRPFYQANHGILCTNHHVWSIFVKMVLCVRVCFLPFVSCTTNLWLIKQATSCSNQRTKAFFHVCIHFVCQT